MRRCFALFSFIFINVKVDTSRDCCADCADCVIRYDAFLEMVSHAESDERPGSARSPSPWQITCHALGVAFGQVSIPPATASRSFLRRFSQILTQSTERDEHRFRTAV